MLGTLGRHIRQQFVGYIALFIALGGVSYAAIKLPPNSVTSKQIKDAQIKTADLGSGAVTASKIKKGSLLAEHFNSGQHLAGRPGPPGPAGPVGDTGAKGDAGINGATSVTIRQADTVTPTDSSGAQTAKCNPGERATGGGVQLVSGSSINQWYFEPGGMPYRNAPGTAPTGWRAAWFNASASTNTIRVYVVCAAP